MSAATAHARKPKSVEQELLEGFFQLYPVDSARALERLTAKGAGRLLRRAPSASAAPVLGHMQPDAAVGALGECKPQVAARLLDACNPVGAANLLARISEAARQNLTARLPKSKQAELEGLLSFPRNTAGAVMDPSVTTFVRTTLVSEAIERVRRIGSRRITDLMITDTDGLFVGVVPLQSVLTAEPDVSLGTMMVRDPHFVRPMTPRDDVVELIAKHKLTSVPVVDFENHVVGILRHDALVEATQRGAVEDLQRMVGTSEEERALSRPVTAIRSRLPWLYVNLLTAFLASAVVGLFEDIIAQITALAVLLPVVAGQSGNTGAQALAVTMRGLALREIRASHAFRVLRKEALVGLLNGVGVAVVTSGCVWLWGGSGLALVMLISMIVAMVIASIAGAAIPIVLTKAKRDPATASSIILTTVTDVFGFLAFLGMATLLSSWLVQ